MTDPTITRLARETAAAELVNLLMFSGQPQPWELARTLGERADAAGRTDLMCDPDSPEVTAVIEALAELRRALTKTALQWAQTDVAVSQRERVDLLERQLLNTEVARLEAVAAGDTGRHNDLANLNRGFVGNAPAQDLRSLVTRWMLQLAGQAAKKTAR